ncbi:M23 family metallopeptidase [Baia soyae]|uniref:Murein DD-endopeptidase MepM/ murein hydrolase activator NlpD n=1 Tax=Baia soyae TaxID=1544746 RepID=A0A4R2S175_9BACL|nr:M23 family metallopeptidase [Baia soyae]TCP69224.1 murein DD-endopeptidase MepM/ murein hydrolase activator NlpD [Baia soyae]
MRWFHKIVCWSQSKRKGSATLEMVSMLPLYILLALLIWQLAIAGLAVVDAQSAMRDALHVAAQTRDEEQAEKDGKAAFGEGKQYQLTKLSVDIKGEEATAKAEIKIPIIFMDDTSPITYEFESTSPLDRELIVGGMGPGGIAGLPFLSGSGDFNLPIKSPTISSGFGTRIHPISGKAKHHNGIDFPKPVGTPIYAAESGIVKKAGPSKGFGNLIVIDHGGGVETWYGHMYSNMIYVREGQTVTKGQNIAGVGSAGGSTGPHLHFEVHINGTPVNPAIYL